MNVTVEEYTSISPITADLNLSLSEGLKLMKNHTIRHLPITEDMKVVGIVSERDILANFEKPWSLELRMKDVMNNSILIAYRNEALGDVAYRLSSEKKGSAIILDDRDELFGIFTTTDALNALVDFMSPVALKKNKNNL